MAISGGTDTGTDIYIGAPLNSKHVISALVLCHNSPSTCIVPTCNLTAIEYLVLKHKKGLRQQLGQQQPSLLLRANTTTPKVDNTQH